MRYVPDSPARSHVLHVSYQLDPSMLSIFVHRKCRSLETRISEGTYGNRYRFFAPLSHIEHCVAAYGAERERGSAAFIAHTHVFGPFTGNRHSGAWKARLCCERAPRPAFASKTVAHRHTERFTRDFNLKPATGTGSDSFAHVDDSKLV